MPRRFTQRALAGADRSIRLLLAATLTAALGCDGGDAAAPVPAGAAAGDAASGGWFVDVTDEVGLDFVHETGALGELRMPEIIGAGAALFDYDADGDLDAYLTNGNHSLGRNLDGKPPLNRMYRQETDGRFSDVTAESGLGDPGYGMGVVVLDFDGDGDLDVYVTNYGADRLYRNRGDGTYEDATVSAGVAVDGWSTSGSACDYDLDGLPDLYIARYVEYDPRRFCTDPAGRREYCTPKAFPGAIDVLLHNEGNGRYRDVTREAGIGAKRGAGLGVVCADLNEDGLPDFYVANDLDPNRLWTNRGDGTFRDEALVKGVAYNLEGRVESGMGVVAADLDNDLDTDLFVTHLSTQTNTYYLNLGAGVGFEDATGRSGLAMASFPYTGFGTAAIDVELDGDLDLVVLNGNVLRGDPDDRAVVPPQWRPYAEPNHLYLNDGAGAFDLLDPGASGLDLPIEISRGLAVGDIDADGDLDLLVNNILTGARLYRNDAPRSGDWLAVRALDTSSGRDVIGAVITIVDGEGKQRRLVTRSFGYLASSDARTHFGLRGGVIRRLDVRWPNGSVESFAVHATGTTLEVVRGEGEGLR